MNFQAKFIKENYLDADGNVIDPVREQFVNMRHVVEYDGKEIVVEADVCVDWKADPDDVIGQVNFALAEKGLRFVYFSVEDDAYRFFLVEDSKE